MFIPLAIYGPNPKRGSEVTISLSAKNSENFIKLYLQFLSLASISHLLQPSQPQLPRVAFRNCLDLRRLAEEWVVSTWEYVINRRYNCSKVEIEFQSMLLFCFNYLFKRSGVSERLRLFLSNAELLKYIANL